MEKNNSIIIAVILGIVIFGLGIGLGLMMKKIPACPKTPVSTSCLLNSKVTQNWMGFAIGEVKEIKDRDLTLTAEGETLKTSILNGARIQILENEKIDEANFLDIKKGDKVEIQFVFIQEANLLSGSVVTIVK